MKLGRYEIVRELGKGAMGVVYLAKDPVIGRLVALKTIRLLDPDDEDAREHQQRFIREAQAAGILSHPSIVTVHDIGEADSGGTSFIAMEYVEGPNLKDLIQRREKLDWPRLAEVIAQVADALDYAHARGIVHRDVKPANIILCGDGAAKITDFGIAKIAAINSNLTSTGQFIGTPNYMAPEQVKGAPVDGRSDLFSLGIVLYESLTGRKPFAGESLTTISYKIVHEDFPPLREAAPDAPEGFEPILAKLLAKHPEERYQRGSEVAADLRKLRRRLLEPWEGADASLLSETTMLSDTGEATRPSGAQRIRTALAPVLTRRVPGIAAAAIIVAALVAVLVPALVLWRGQVEVPEINVERERAMQQTRRLRLEGNQLLADGNIAGAYQRFKEIQRVRPTSPANNRLLQQLEQALSDQELEQQRLAHAQELFDEGRELYEKKRWEQAIRRFEEAFALNPREGELVNYLRMAREQLNLADMRRETPLAGTSGSEQAITGTSALQTVVTTTVADGYVLVRVGGRTIVHENLWVERGGIIRRRATRELSISSTVRAGTQEIEVWIVVPAKGINTRRVLQHTFGPDTRHTLRIAADPARDTYDVSIS